MDFEFTKQQKLARKIACDFAEAELGPVAQQLDENQEFPADVIKKLARLGFMGITLPVEYGGCGLDSICFALIIEELARFCASTAIIVAVHNSVSAYPIYMFGTDMQKQGYLEDLAKGRKLGAFALTESHAGSDPAAIKTRAELKNNHYILNGVKTFITSGGTADVLLVMAVTDPSKKARGITAFIIEKGMDGFSVGKKENKLGIRASDTCELVFENCSVPADNVLGKPGGGLFAALSALSYGRIGVAAQAIGVSRCAMEQSVEYSRERKQFGRKIADFQAVQWMIADMATEIEAARFLVLRAAKMKDEGLPFSKGEDSMAKVYASEVAMRAATKAVQIHGGYGCIKDYKVERCFRDAKVIEIYEGTSEIQRMVIARSLLK